MSNEPDHQRCKCNWAQLRPELSPVKVPNEGMQEKEAPFERLVRRIYGIKVIKSTMATKPCPQNIWGHAAYSQSGVWTGPYLSWLLIPHAVNQQSYISQEASEVCSVHSQYFLYNPCFPLLRGLKCQAELIFCCGEQRKICLRGQDQFLWSSLTAIRGWSAWKDVYLLVWGMACWWNVHWSLVTTVRSNNKRRPKRDP